MTQFNHNREAATAYELAQANEAEAIVRQRKAVNALLTILFLTALAVAPAVVIAAWRWAL